MTSAERGPVVGFIGLGAMGGPMARRLLGAGYPLLLCDADPARAAALAEEAGGTPASPREMGGRADVIITMLPNSAIVEQVLLGPDGALAGMRAGSAVVEMSSGDPVRTRVIAAAARERGVRFVDAPVSGGVPRAVSGELSIMAGGDDEDVAAVTDILSVMGTTVTRTGEVGSAHAMKALNNLCSAGGFLIGVEVLLIGHRFGLSPEMMVDVLNASTGMNNSTKRKFRQYVLSRSFDSAFSLDLLVKDLDIALGLARATGTAAPIAEAAVAYCNDARRELGPGRDHTELARYAEHLAGSELTDPPPPA